MEHTIHLAASARDRRAVIQRIINRVARALHSGLLVALQVMLGAFVVGYPLLRLGYLGPAPEGPVFEVGFGITVGTMALILFLMEGTKE